MKASKYHVGFYLQKTYNTKTSESQIRMRVRWEGKVVQFNSGFTISPDKWADGEVKKNACNKDGFTRREINEYLASMEERVDAVFAAIRAQYGRFPSKEELCTAMGNKTSQSEKPMEAHFCDFYSDHSTRWSDATFLKFNTIRKHLSEYDPKMNINGFTKAKIDGYRDYLIARGLSNPVVMKEWKTITWFLNWCDKRGLVTNHEWKDYKMSLKRIKHKIIYLEMDELKRLFHMDFPPNKQYLSDARDFFCFSCFTGLRYSDVANLEWSCVSDDCVRVDTIKDCDHVDIPLNKYSKAILDRHRSLERPFRKVSSQKLNEYIKEVCFLADITQPERITQYRGAERIEQSLPKYKLISTHTGRRTFICNALKMGISVTTVMLMTGHSDFKAMQPYISASANAQREAMEAFDLG